MTEMKKKNWPAALKIAKKARDKSIYNFIQCPVHLSRGQRDRRQRASLQHQNFDFLFYLGWSGCFTQIKHNIMKVVQS